MKQPRAGVNTSFTLTTTPVQVADPSVVKGGPAIQNKGGSSDMVYIFQGAEADATVDNAFFLQQMAMIDFSDAAQQNPIWAWSNNAAGVPIVVNKAS